jgi:hypothetical protein
MPVILDIWEDEIRRIAVEGQLRQIARAPISKITRAKWTGGVAQAKEHLLCKCKTLNSNPNPNRIKKQKNAHWNLPKMSICGSMNKLYCNAAEQTTGTHHTMGDSYTPKERPNK